MIMQNKGVLMSAFSWHIDAFLCAGVCIGNCCYAAHTPRASREKSVSLLNRRGLEPEQGKKGMNRR